MDGGSGGGDITRRGGDAEDGGDNGTPMDNDDGFLCFNCRFLIFSSCNVAIAARCAAVINGDGDTD